MNEELMCPLLVMSVYANGKILDGRITPQQLDDFRKCGGETCAWFIKSRSECAIKTLAVVALMKFTPGPDARD